MAERAEIIISGKDQTAAAFATAQRNLAAMRKSADATVSSLRNFAAGFGAIGLATAGLNAALNPRQVIDYADQLNKLSQRTGIAVEELSALDYQAKLAGVSTEELAGALKRFNLNIAAAGRGEKEQAEAFRLIGVSVTDAAGRARSADKVLADVADRFATYADGPEKLAIANAIGGKSFEQLIPLLNGGRQGFADARAELEKFGGVISGKLAADAERFNDNMTKLGVASSALKVSIAGGLLDRLGDLSDRMVEAARNGTLLQFSVERLKDVLSGKATRELAFGPSLEPDALQEAQRELEATTAQVAKLKAQLAASPGNQVIARQLALVESTAKSAADEVARLSAATSPGLSLDAFRSGERDRTPVRGAAPRLQNAEAQRDAEARLRKILEGRIKAIQEAAAIEADLFAFQNTRLQDEFSNGERSIENFYAEKARIQQQSLDVQQALFDKEIAALREFQARQTKPQEREDIENRIADVLAKQAKAYREAGQATEVAEAQRKRATDDFRRSLVELDAQIAEISGDRFGAELLRNAQRIQDAQRQLAAGGGDTGRIETLERALRLQTEFSRLQEEISRVGERAQLAEEQFAIRAERAGLSRAETERELQRLREGELVQIDRLITQTEALAATSQDPAVLLYLERLRVARKRAFDAKDPGLIRFNELAKQGGDAIAQSFTDALLEGKKLSDVLDDLGNQLLRLVTQDLITKPLADSITGAIRSIGANGTGGGAERLFSGIVGQIGGGTGDAGAAAASASATAAKAAETTATAAATTALITFTAAVELAAAASVSSGGGDAVGSLLDVSASVFHGGGVVSGGGRSRRVAVKAWDGASRYHGGGVVGEVPAILRRGEEVLTEADPRHRWNMGGESAQANVTQNFYLAQPTDRASQAQLATRAATALGRAQRNL